HAADQAAAHVRPVRPFGAVEPDQGEDLAPGVGTFENRELARKIDRAGGSPRGVSAGPALRRIVESARADCQAHLGQRALGDDVAVLLGVVEIVPGSSHGWGLLVQAFSEWVGASKVGAVAAGDELR